MVDTANEASPYVLGHSDQELDRIRTQAQWLEPITRQFMQEAGVREGMRVLDVGTGTGAVAFLAAELVGESGVVIGADKAPEAVASARREAQRFGLARVEFLEGDPSEMEFDLPFDAIVGRYVLPFQTEPGATLRRLAHHLRKGGLLLFHEPDWTFVRSDPHAPLYERACRWIVDASTLRGQSWSFLEKVNSTFEQAGLPAPTLRMQTFLANGSHSRQWLMAVGDMVESLLPAIVELGLATAEQVDLPTLRDRLWQEATAETRMIVGRSELGIWARVD